MHFEAKTKFDQQMESGNTVHDGHADRSSSTSVLEQEDGVSRPLFVPRLADCAELEVLAACRQPALVAALCRGQLGVQVYQVMITEEPHNAILSPNQLRHQLPCCPSLVAVSVNGAMARLAVLPDEQLKPLLQLQHLFHQKEEEMSLVQHLGKDHATAWRWTPAHGKTGCADSALGGNCIDVTYLSNVLPKISNTEMNAQNFEHSVSSNIMKLLRGFL